MHQLAHSFIQEKFEVLLKIYSRQWPG